MNRRADVVDANIAFKALSAGRGDLRYKLAPATDLEFHGPRFLFVELFKHKERLTQASGLPESELLEALYSLVTRLVFDAESTISLGHWMEAHRLCHTVDEKDTPYVALTLHLDGRLWTEDKELKAGLRAGGFERFFEP
jgi:predicted nucleic acid-binding protein